MREKDRGHDDDDGDSLQDHAPLHKALRAPAIATLHHVVQAHPKDDGDGKDGERD